MANSRFSFLKGRKVPIFFFAFAFVFSITENRFPKEYHWDAAGYYAYLPAAVIYQDFSFDFTDSAAGISKDEFTRGETGQKVNKYGAGVAILQLPFFLAGHFFALILPPKANGYSLPYKISTAVGAIFYGSLGLFFLGLVLRNFFTKMTSDLALIAVGFGTNLLFYTMGEPMMSHVYSFFLFSLVMWIGMNWKRNFEEKYFFALCFFGGLIAATRLTNVIFLIVPLLWGVQNSTDFKNTFAQFFKLKSKNLFGALLFLLPLLPQLLYLKFASGSLVNPYGQESFFWTEPLFFKVLFSYRKGWMLWSPVIIFGFIGFFFAKKHPGFLGILIFTLLNLYVVSSWWCWWYGGSFGMRALTEAIVPLSIGIAFCIEKLYQKKPWKYGFRSVFWFLIVLSFLQTWQYSKGMIHPDAMSEKSYWAVFGYPPPLSKKAEEAKVKNLDFTDPKKAMTDPKYRRGM